MADINNFQGVKVGRHTVDLVEMIDKDTCLLSFESEVIGNVLVTTQAERWLDEDKWWFEDNYYDKEGNFIDWTECHRLCETEIKESKNIINKFLKQLSINNMNCYDDK